MLTLLPELNEEENSINALVSYLHDHCFLINRLLSFGNTSPQPLEKLLHLIITLFRKVCVENSAESSLLVFCT